MAEPYQISLIDLLDGVLEHGWDEPGEVGRGELEAGVCVDFDEPRLQILVNHEVVTENFEAAVAALRVHLSRNGLDRVRRQRLNLRHDGLHEFAADVLAVEVLLELGVGELYKQAT